MKLSAVIFTSAAATASVFACSAKYAVNFATTRPRREPLVPFLTTLGMANGETKSKRKAALKEVGKVADMFGSVALVTTGVPSVTSAAVEAVQTVRNNNKMVGVGTGAFAAGIAVTKVLESIKGKSTPAPIVKSLKQSFPKAVTNQEIISKVKVALEKYGYGKNSLVATSLCADEVNRVLEKDLSKVYGDNFSMGGLAGFPFGGVTSFGAMASHIPDGGSCLVVFGPHVGVDSTGKVGTVERRGRGNGGACCGSAVAACGYVSSVHAGEVSKHGPPTDPIDAQQNFVGNMLLPYAAYLEQASNKMAELPYALFDAQKKMMHRIIQAGAGCVGGDGKISVLGGIQINTPDGVPDYFLPLSFEVFDNKGTKMEDLSSALDCGFLPGFVEALNEPVMHQSIEISRHIPKKRELEPTPELIEIS